MPDMFNGSTVDTVVDTEGSDDYSWNEPEEEGVYIAERGTTFHSDREHPFGREIGRLGVM
ncbi:MAG: hypothetical protein WAU03_04035 [Candidatus Saccharimonas aalborgensis]